MAAPMTEDKFLQMIEKNDRKSPEIVVFEDPTVYNKKHNAKKDDTKDVTSSKPRDLVTLDRPVLSLKKAKYDVRKFGISGFDRQQKEEARVQLAIELGARPRKREGKNYKQLVAQLKAKKEAELEQEEKEKQMGIRLPKAFKSKQKKGERVRALKCQVGRYENGFQMIPKRLLSSKQRASLGEPLVPK